MTPELKGFLLLGMLKGVGVFTAIMVAEIFVVWAERRLSGFMQDRLGPNRVGPQGLLQTVADGLKNFLKEETFPDQADRTLFILAPLMSFVPAMLLISVVPFAAPMPVSFDFSVPLLGQFAYDGTMPMVIADLPIGFLFILAVSSLGVYGMVLAGWSSNSKYAFIGGLRAGAQMISYEIAMGMSIIGVLLLAGNVTLGQVIATQQETLWFVFPLTVGFVLFMVSALAETNRMPFDLPEAEAELVTGYHTEYSAMKFSMFYIAEYAALMTMSALMATLFFGGWDIPFTTWDDVRVEGGVIVAGEPSVLKSLATLGVFGAKTVFFIFCYIWIRWTLPRFRFDQLMALGWKFMFPAALGYIVVIALGIWGLDSAGLDLGWTYGMILFAGNIVLLVGLLWMVDRGRTIAGQRLRREGGTT